jgi:hypothetical protein
LNLFQIGLQTRLGRLRWFVFQAFFPTLKPLHHRPSNDLRCASRQRKEDSESFLHRSTAADLLLSQTLSQTEQKTRSRLLWAGILVEEENYRTKASIISGWSPQRVPKKPPKSVTPAQAGIQKATEMLDSGFRRNDVACFRRTFSTPSQAFRAAVVLRAAP